MSNRMMEYSAAEIRLLIIACCEVKFDDDFGQRQNRN